MKELITNLVRRIQRRARGKRGELFRNGFNLGVETKILDIGSEDGTNIARVLRDTEVKAENVYIADIDARVVEEGQRKYGFNPVQIPESGRLPFPDHYFDIVYCSSVIEHVTVPKRLIWSIRSGREFKKRAWSRQLEFAQEIARLGKQYYVQTPNKYFLIESHTWLPFVGFLPRRLLLPVLSVSNRGWIKQTTPDWNLLSARQMRDLFPGAELRRERFFGLTKSIIIIDRRKSATG